MNDLRNYLELAKSYAQMFHHKDNNFLAISFGLSGSGKSRVCSQLADQLGAIQLSSDIERKRLFSSTSGELYSASTTDKTYTYLMKTTELVINAGYSVIIDATFLDKKWRHKAHLMAEKYQIPFHILACYAEQKVIKERLRLRQYETNQVSDANIKVMESQLKKTHRLELNEKKYEIPIDTEQPLDCPAIIQQLASSPNQQTVLSHNQFTFIKTQC